MSESEKDRMFRETEFVARRLAHEDGKDFDKIPNVSTLWFKDRLGYRAQARTAIQAVNLFRLLNHKPVWKPSHDPS